MDGANALILNGGHLGQAEGDGRQQGIGQGLYVHLLLIVD